VTRRNVTWTWGDRPPTHPGWVNALFADGSVRFVRQTLPIRTLAALVTRNAGEVSVNFD
jgi:prepilin-type processing-associated H-X9-DG protein